MPPKRPSARLVLGAVLGVLHGLPGRRLGVAPLRIVFLGVLGIGVAPLSTYKRAIFGSNTPGKRRRDFSVSHRNYYIYRVLRH